MGFKELLYLDLCSKTWAKITNYTTSWRKLRIYKKICRNTFNERNLWPLTLPLSHQPLFLREKMIIFSGFNHYLNWLTYNSQNSSLIGLSTKQMFDTRNLLVHFELVCHVHTWVCLESYQNHRIYLIPIVDWDHSFWCLCSRLLRELR